uniref:Uncharacterized protein n=1 Tax=Cacopsylla melanoneura TaxID=428564 RepID=A0A8D8R1J3_9HEMI
MNTYRILRSTKFKKNSVSFFIFKSKFYKTMTTKYLPRSFPSPLPPPCLYIVLFIHGILYFVNNIVGYIFLLFCLLLLLLLPPQPHPPLPPILYSISLPR